MQPRHKVRLGVNNCKQRDSRYHPTPTLIQSLTFWPRNIDEGSRRITQIVHAWFMIHCIESHLPTFGLHDMRACVCGWVKPAGFPTRSQALS